MSDAPNLSEPQDGDSELVRKLRQEIKDRDARLSEKESELTTVTKESIFRAAGLDPNKGQGKLLFKAYDGDLSEDAIKAAAEEYGLIEPEPEVEPETHPDKQANQQIDTATRGAEASGIVQKSPTDVGQEAYDKVFRETGGDIEAASAARFAAKMAATQQAKKAG